MEKEWQEPSSDMQSKAQVGTDSKEKNHRENGKEVWNQNTITSLQFPIIIYNKNDCLVVLVLFFNP